VTLTPHQQKRLATIPTASVSPDIHQCLGRHRFAAVCHQGPVPGLPGHGPGRGRRLRRPLLPALEVPPVRREGPKMLAWSEILRFERRLADGSYRQSLHRIKTRPGSGSCSRCAFFSFHQPPPPRVIALPRRSPPAPHRAVGHQGLPAWSRPTIRRRGSPSGVPLATTWSASHERNSNCRKPTVHKPASAQMTRSAGCLATTTGLPTPRTIPGDRVSPDKGDAKRSTPAHGRSAAFLSSWPTSRGAAPLYTGFRVGTNPHRRCAVRGTGT
jgi:hypothetical protein